MGRLVPVGTGAHCSGRLRSRLGSGVFPRDTIGDALCRHFSAMHREPRSVVLCLLDVGRIGYKFGLEPPSLIRMEKEIEREEQLETGSMTSSSDR